MRKHNEYLQRESIYDAVVKEIPSWIPPYRRWSAEQLSRGEPLVVYFMNECPEHWKYRSDRIYRNYIMEVVQSNVSWKNCFTVGVNEHDSHIRVMFYGEISYMDTLAHVVANTLQALISCVAML